MINGNELNTLEYCYRNHNVNNAEKVNTVQNLSSRSGFNIVDYPLIKKDIMKY